MRVGAGSMPRTLGSGRWTEPMPRSAWGRGRTRWRAPTVERAGRGRRSRARTPPPSRPGPDAARTSRARACIDGVGRGGRRSVTRSRWRASRATSRRAASRTSTTAASCGSAWRTAAVRTRGSAVVAGEREQAGGVAEAGRGALGSAVADHLDGERRRAAAGRAIGPARPRPRRAAGEHGPADVGVGTEEDDERAGTTRRPWASRLPGGGGQLGDELRRGDRLAALTAEVGGGDQPAEPPPSGAGVETRAPATSEHGDPWPSGVDDRPAPHRGTGAGAARPTLPTRTALLPGPPCPPGPTARSGAPARRVRPVGRAAGGGSDGHHADASRPDAGLTGRGSGRRGRSVSGRLAGAWTARSTPRIGSMPASVHAWTNRTAP